MAVRNAPTETSSNSQSTDVVVVGGGFSGIQAAWDLQQAGLDCVVLEAASRLGGRSYSYELQSGPGTVELGAGWINQETQPKVFEIAKRLGLEMVEQYTDGDDLWQMQDGEMLQVAPDTSAAKLLADLNEKMKDIFDPASQKIDIPNVSAFPAHQDVSLEEWAKMQGLASELDQDMFRTLLYGILGREARDIGIHYFLDYIKSAQGWHSVVEEDENGAQHLKIRQGTSAVAEGLAAELSPGSVLLNSPAKRIVQDTEGVTVHTSQGRIFRCRKAILAIPSNVYHKIEFSPPLPANKDHIVSHTKPGLLSKAVVTYRSAWWKDLGFSGKMLSFRKPVSVTFDISNGDDQQYSLAVFIARDPVERWAALDEAERKESIIEHIAEMAGSENASLAREVLEIDFSCWSEEEYLGGAPTAMMGPGLLSRYGDALREKFQHIHIAGSETAFERKGYLEGALLAGSRAANEVIRAL